MGEKRALTEYTESAEGEESIDRRGAKGIRVKLRT